MAALAKQNVIFGFGSADQKRSAKHSQVGRLMLAMNVYQTNTKAFRKRNGHSAYVTTTDSGSITTGKSLAATANGLVLRTSDTAFLWSAAQAKWLNRGAIPTIAPTVDVAFPIHGTRPLHVVAGTKTYYFAGTTAPVATGAGSVTLHYRVVDAASGVEIQPDTATSTTLSVGTSTTLPYRAVYAGGFVWYFISPTSVLKFDPASPATAPTTVATGVLSGVAQLFDVMTATNGNIVMIHGSGANTFASYINSTTGALVGAPGSVNVGASQAAGSGALFKNATGTDGFFYFVGPTTALILSVFKINATTLAISTTTGLGTLPAGGTTQTASDVVSGYLSGVNQYVVYYTDGAATTREAYTTYRFSVSGGTPTPTVFARGRYVVSDPFQVGSTWYVILGHDDDNNVQCSYYVFQDASATVGVVVGRTLYDMGGGDYAQRALTNTTAAFSGFSAPVTVTGNTALFLVNGYVAPGTYASYRVQFDFAASLGHVLSTTSGEVAVFPGAWPYQLTGGSTFGEYQPPMFPRAITTALVAGSSSWTAGAHSSVALYSFRDVNGNEHLSAPSPSVATSIVTTTNVLRHTVPTLRGINSNVGIVIKLYVSKTGTTSPLYLVGSVANDPTVDTLTIDATREPVAGETVYTDGGVLENAPPPPFRFAFEWRARTFLGDCEFPDEVWPSKEYAPGFGPQFNALLKFRCSGGTGRVRAGGAVDGNDAVLFKSDAAFYISGLGPDDSGRGNYTPTQLSGAPGCTNPASTVTTPIGLMYQAVDGGIWVISPGLAAQYVGQGVDDYKSGTVTAVEHHAKRQHVRFFLDSGVCIVFDYGNPLPDEGAIGQWYVWSGTNAVGACVSSDVEHYVTSAGLVYMETDGVYADVSAILMKLKIPLNFAGVVGHVLTYEGTIVGEYLGAHNVQATYNTDVENGTPRTTQVFGPKAVAAAPEAFRFPPNEMRAATAELTIEETGAGTTAACVIQGIGFVIGVKPGVRPLNVSQRF